MKQHPVDTLIQTFFILLFFIAIIWIASPILLDLGAEETGHTFMNESAIPAPDQSLPFRYIERCLDNCTTNR